jgi:excisionase family DNA binding protein
MPQLVPSLDDIAREPSLARELATSVVASLLGQAHVAVAALEARLLVASVERDEPRPADHEPARLMTAAEVSVRLGFKVGYVYELARAGRIKSLRQGKYARFTEAAVLEYIAGKGSAASPGASNMLSSGLDTGKQSAYGVVRGRRRIQERSQRDRPHTNGVGAPPGRASADGQPMGARVRVDS